MISLVRKGNLELLPITGLNHQELFVLIRIVLNMLIQMIKVKIKQFHPEEVSHKLICWLIVLTKILKILKHPKKYPEVPAIKEIVQRLQEESETKKVVSVPATLCAQTNQIPVKCKIPIKK